MLPADRAERASLLAGVALAAASLATLGALWLADPALGRALALQGVAHTALGRETGIPVGLAGGVPIALSGLAAWVQDAVTLLIGYPLAMALARGTLRLPWLERRIHAPHPTRDRFARRTEAAGVSLLAASLWVPFLPAGALAAALAGRVAGYRIALLLPALVVSSFGASLVYARLFAAAVDVVGDARLVVALAVGVAAVTFAAAWLVRRRRQTTV